MRGEHGSGEARGPRPPGPCVADSLQHMVLCSILPGPGWGGRRGPHVRGRPGTLRSHGWRSGPCLRPAGAATAAWVGQRPLEPGRCEAAKAWAWLPGRRAGKVGTRHPRGPVGRSMEAGPGRPVFRGRPGLEDPLDTVEEVRSSGCNSTDPSGCRGRAQFRSLSARLGLGRAAPSRHSGCRSFSSQVTVRKSSYPPPLLGCPC